IVNFVVNRFGEPLRAFCGHYLWAHRAGIAFGDREVWGAEIGRKGDLTIATLGANLARGAHAPSPLEQAAIGTRSRDEARSPGDPGTLIFIGHPAGPEAVPSPWEQEKFSWTFDQIFKEHERRDQQRTPRDISDRCKSIRGEYYARRPGHLCDVVFAVNRPSELVLARNRARYEPDLQSAVDATLRDLGADAHVLILPEAANTLPMPHFHSFPELAGMLPEGYAAVDAVAAG
ncbi:MAG: hypothetical protein M3442_13595, partial [Chloroflexota bacterium]|nr:hypothetical protein [Chloroflexota bacterium]